MRIQVCMLHRRGSCPAASSLKTLLKWGWHWKKKDVQQDERSRFAILLRMRAWKCVVVYNANQSNANLEYTKGMHHVELLEKKGSDKCEGIRLWLVGHDAWREVPEMARGERDERPYLDGRSYGSWWNIAISICYMAGDQLQISKIWHTPRTNSRCISGALWMLFVTWEWGRLCCDYGLVVISPCHNGGAAWKTSVMNKPWQLSSLLWYDKQSQP